MTKFEQELVEVIKNGCPCGSEQDLKLYYLEEVGQSISVSQNGKGLIFWNKRTVDESPHATDISVECPECTVELWTKKNGWIPELADIVKEE